MSVQNIIFLLCNLYHGPQSKRFVKNGVADFGDFLVILLIQAKVNAASAYKMYPGRLPKGSILRIQSFLRIFKILTPTQQAILANFILNDDVDGYFYKHFGNDWQRILDKYEYAFRVILPALFRNGLAESPKYSGRYACSTAKWVIIKTIFWYMERNTTRLDVEGLTSYAIQIMRNYRQNLCFKLYLQTITHIEFTKDPHCFEIADNYFQEIVKNDHSHYEAWMDFIADFRRKTYIQVGESPKDWNSGLICWLMNQFENYETLIKYIAENHL